MRVPELNDAELTYVLGLFNEDECREFLEGQLEWPKSLVDVVVAEIKNGIHKAVRRNR